MGSTSVSAVHDTGANITWSTNSPANSTVEYGTTTGYGSVRIDSTVVVNHTIAMDGLSPGTAYHYRIRSTDLSGHVYRSADKQFTTTGIASGETGGGGVGGGGISYGILPGVFRPATNGVSSPVTEVGTLFSGSIVSYANGMTDLRSSWSVNIIENPPAGARFVTFILSQPSDATRSAFDSFLALHGLQMTALAYVTEVTKSQPVATGSAIIQMDASRSWVSQNGGVNAVRIIREGDDGQVQILGTRFSNYDMDTGYMNF